LLLGSTKQKVIALADVQLFAQEIWSGTTHVTQLDGTEIQATVSFVEKENPNGTPGTSNPDHADLIVQSGQVQVTVPPNTGAGCPQSVLPDHHTIAPDEGSMVVTYDFTSGLETENVVGGGTTVWPATYTFECPNGTQLVDSDVQAQWWPIDPLNPTKPLPAQNGSLDVTYGTPTATVTIHLVRQ
jgi:hypothetical protein